MGVNDVHSYYLFRKPFTNHLYFLTLSACTSCTIINFLTEASLHIYYIGPAQIIVFFLKMQPTLLSNPALLLDRPEYIVHKLHYTIMVGG